MAEKNKHPPESDSVEPLPKEVAPATATPHPKPPSEPTAEELEALMEAATPEAHQVPAKNRAIETSTVAGEYVIGHPKHPKKEE